ncbi:hypothetical protein [Sphaerotilus sp.]|uniref:hypothetical protein n=1 Tax=Sphaerotilus sp. TaxID=2093942 RepID=UPI00286E11B0|nr:hypothetical protein [Sphaerotilus sp.]
MPSHYATLAFPTPLPPGTCLGPYVLTGCLGDDLDGFDYAAEERHSGRTVAVREGCPVGLVQRIGVEVVPLPDAEADFRDWLARWTRLTGHWAQAGRSADLARLAPSALVRIEAQGQANGTAWVCLTPVTGRTLRQVAEDGPGWPDRATVDAGLHACCSAVEPLHRLGEVHGSLTPERVRVQDSGAWCLPLPDTDPSRQPLSPWLALEQTDAGRDAGLATGPWTDVHGIAALAHWLLTGSAPPSLSRRQADAPDCWAELERVEPDPLRRRALRSALALKPADRLGSVAALRMALGWSEHHAPVVAEPKPGVAPPPPAPPPAPVKPDRTGVVTLVGLLVSFSAVFSVLWINHEPAPPEAPPVPIARTAEPAKLVPPVAAPVAPPRPASAVVIAPPPTAAPAPPPRPVRSAETAKPVRPPVAAASRAPVPVPPPVQTAAASKKKPSEACIDWLRRRSLEIGGAERERNPACE